MSKMSFRRLSLRRVLFVLSGILVHYVGCYSFYRVYSFVTSGVIRFIGYTRSLRRVLFVLSGILVHYVGSTLSLRISLRRISIYFIGYYRARCTFGLAVSKQKENMAGVIAENSFIADRGKRCIREVLFMLERQAQGTDDLDGVDFRIDWLIGEFFRYAQIRPTNEIFTSVLHTYLQQAKQEINKLFDHDIYQGYLPKKFYSGDRGRPAFEIPKQQLEMFLGYNFSVRQIYHMLGVYMSTVNRRLKDYELSVSQTYSAITNEALDRIVQETIIEFPSCGYRYMTGYLKARGIHVQQLRIRVDASEKIRSGRCGCSERCN